MSNEEADVLFRRYLKEVRGIDLEEDGGMVFIIKFKRLGVKYEATVKNVINQKQAIEKLKEYTGGDIKICKIKLFETWQKFTID